MATWYTRETHSLLDRVGLEVGTHFSGHSILRKQNSKFYRGEIIVNLE